jgi:probable rRNA maturation factor
MPIRISGPPSGVRGDRVDLGLLRRRSRIMLSQVGHGASELSIALVDDPAIRGLNRDWRGKKRPTDVLSFSLLEGEGTGHRGKLLGDVVISVESAARQAAARHRGLDEEIARLVIHGLLHILGHDHEVDADAKVMEAEQRRLWCALA